MGYIDFHTHILFDVDHGVQKLEDSVAMLKLYKEQGFEAVALTPHIYHPLVNCKVQNIGANYAKLQEEADRIGIRVLLGSELYLEAQKEVKTIPIAGKYSLVEFSTVAKPVDLEGKLNQIIDQNLQPVIAHVERYTWLKPSSKEMEMFFRLGCLISVNAEGVENSSAKPYLDKNLVDIIASDNHGDATLPSRLRKVLESFTSVADNMYDIARACLD